MGGRGAGGCNVLPYLHVRDAQRLDEVLVPHRLVERELGGDHKAREQARLPVGEREGEARAADGAEDVDERRHDARVRQLQVPHDR